jgi:hypothetical protein
MKTSKTILLSIIIVCGIFAFSKTTFAASKPVLLFSDLTDGVISGGHWGGAQEGNGAAVSIWGRNFGSIRNGGTVTVCGVTLDSDDDFAEWGATTNPTVPIGMQRVTFWLKPGMQTGASTIKVTTADGSTDTIPFYCRSTGNIYFLDNVNGNNNYNGLYPTVQGGNNGPKRTTGWARANLVAGDSVYLRGGTPYQDCDAESAVEQGGLFTFYDNFNNGLQYNSITITAYPTEEVKLWNLDADGSDPKKSAVITDDYGSEKLEYWTFSKLTMVGRDQSVNYGHGWGTDEGISHFRLVGNDMTTTWVPGRNGGTQEGMIVQLYGGTYLYILGNYVHHQDCGTYADGVYVSDDTSSNVAPGTAKAYQIYLGGYGTNDYIYIGYNDMGYGYQGRGFQIFGHEATDTLDNCYIFNNYFHDNYLNTLALGGGDDNNGIDYDYVKNIYFYNNVVADTTNSFLSTFGSINTHGRFGGNYYIYNNVFYHTYPDNIAIHIAPETDLAVLKNNIIYSVDTNTNSYYSFTGNSPYINPGTHIILDTGHNIYYGEEAGAPAWETSTLRNNNPQFISANPTTWSDFQLQSTSPAIDAGTLSVSSVVTNDFLGISRPQGSGFDIGAYEYAENTPVDILAPASPGGLSVR